MAAVKKKPVVNYDNPPETLDGHPFFGIRPDKEQKALIDAVWAREKKVYLIDSIAGSGKTLISTALGVLMVKYGIYDKITYITFPGIYEKTQGFLPGDLLSKSEPYFQPLYDALITIDELPDHVCNTSLAAVEDGTMYIECAVSTYMRGINIRKSFVIIDEAENADLQTLAKVLSRISDDCTVMVIGHAGQCDMYDKTQSGFTACIDYQTKHHPDICQAFNLTTNHRGLVSQWADFMLKEYNPPKTEMLVMTEIAEKNRIYLSSHTRSMNPEDINDSWFWGDASAIREYIIANGTKGVKRTILYETNNSEEADDLLLAIRSAMEKYGNDVLKTVTRKMSAPEEVYRLIDRMAGRRVGTED